MQLFSEHRGSQDAEGASLQGILNLSPYSYFNVMSHDPPVVCIGMTSSSPTEKRPSPMKDSQQNITDTGQAPIKTLVDLI